MGFQVFQSKDRYCDYTGQVMFWSSGPRRYSIEALEIRSGNGDINSSFKINKGLRISRQLFCDLTSAGMPIASEMSGTNGGEV